MGKPAELSELLGGSDLAQKIAHMWDTLNHNRNGKIEDWKELRNYVFATDTSTTSNSSLPWKNSTTLPKLCQIRDNLHSNYLSALFPNDNWLKWEAHSRDAAKKDKAKVITAYMSNKCRIGGFRTEISKILYDYIDTGNAFATVKFETRYKEMPDGSRIPDYIGPKVVRISPYDIVFNPLASSFQESYKIIRSIKSVGELKQMSEEEPDNMYLKEALAKTIAIRSNAASYGKEDWDKAEGYLADGFGSLQEYYQSDYVEVLEFFGDIHDADEGEYETNKIITVIDRAHVIRKDDIPSWLGHAPIYHAGWRFRPDNLWAMGPLENLVGMQYRMDQLENLKADAMDLSVLPPLVIQGDVEEFEYGPNSEIHIDEAGSVTELGRNAQWVLTASQDIAQYELRMEQFAGAPSEAMGIRTPGEKTAFEVNQLQNAAGRIFQEKITSFEINLLEPILNAMLETSTRNASLDDTVRVLDDDLGVQEFINIKAQDITAAGKIRPIGARHFAAQAQLMQNITQLYNSNVGQMIMPHTSSVQLSKVIEDILNIHNYDVFRENVAVGEQQELQRQQGQAQEDLMTEMQTPGVQ